MAITETGSLNFRFRNVAAAAFGPAVADAGEKFIVRDSVRLLQNVFAVAGSADLFRQPPEPLIAFLEHQHQLLFGPLAVDLVGSEVPFRERQLIQLPYCSGDAVVVLKTCVIVASGGKKGNATAMIAEKAAAICSSVAEARISSLAGRSSGE
jgi:hypothetical protein